MVRLPAAVRSSPVCDPVMAARTETVALINSLELLVEFEFSTNLPFFERDREIVRQIATGGGSMAKFLCAPDALHGHQAGQP